VTISRADLAAALCTTDPRELLPPRRAGEESRLVAPLRLIAAYPLGTVSPTDELGQGPWATVVGDSAGALLGVPLVATGRNPLAVRRAVAGDGAASALLDRLTHPGPVPAVDGAFGLYSLGVGALPTGGAPAERGLDVDQAQDSVVVADAAVVKWAVHLALPSGEPPAARLLAHLSAVGFTEVPAPIGYLVWRGFATTVAGELSPRLLLASAAEFLPGAKDGWEWYVDDLLAHLEGGLPFEDVVEPAHAIGGLIARLHLALATSTRDDQRPVGVASQAEARCWRDEAMGTLDEALAVTVGEPGTRLLACADEARGVVAQLAWLTETAVTLVHGDLHVGQILRWEGGYVVNDFDGNPVLSPQQQAAPQPPARDVAGMLRSLDHVGRIVLRRTGPGRAPEVDRWIGAVRDAFLRAYRAELAGAGMSGLLDERLLLPFEVEQECREYVYAARHLSHWVYVPDAAMAALLPVVE
jgi:maltokinase